MPVSTPGSLSLNAPASYELTFDVFPGLFLGEFDADVSVAVTTSTGTVVDEAPVQVISVGARRARRQRRQQLSRRSRGAVAVTGRPSTSATPAPIGDVDYFTVPAPAIPSTPVQVFISNPANDNDLFAYIPLTDEVSDQPATISIGTQPFIDEAQVLSGSATAGGQPEQLADLEAARGRRHRAELTTRPARGTATDEIEVLSVNGGDGGGDHHPPGRVSANGEASNAPYALRVVIGDPVAPPPSCDTSHDGTTTFRGGDPTAAGYNAGELHQLCDVPVDRKRRVPRQRQAALSRPTVPLMPAGNRMDDDSPTRVNALVD